MMDPIEAVKNMWSTVLSDEEGASLVEYVLMVALIAVVCIAAVTLLGAAAKAKFETTTAALNSSN
jgi:pilus assembly protein Flp/PilA